MSYTTDALEFTNLSWDGRKDCQINLIYVPFPSNPHKMGKLLEWLRVKIECRVMLMTNLSDGLTNGSMGETTPHYCT